MRRKLVAIAGFSIVPILLIHGCWRQKQLTENPGYTITTTVKQIRTLKNGLQIRHFYFVNGEKFTDDHNKDERLNIIYPNGKYLVKFSTKHPSISKVIWTKPVPDTLKNIPKEGWKIIPF